MLISKTPYRISLFGGGTDYPSWYKITSLIRIRDGRDAPDARSV